MLLWVSWLYSAYLDPVLRVLFVPLDGALGWLTRFNPVLSVTIIGVLTGMVMNLFMKFFSNQRLLGKCLTDMDKLKLAIAAAKKAGDKDRAAQLLNVNKRVSGKRAWASLKPALIPVLPVVVVVLWAMARLGYEPVRPGYLVDVMVDFEDEAAGSYVHIVAPEGLEVVGPAIVPAQLPVDTPAPPPAGLESDKPIKASAYAGKTEGFAAWVRANDQGRLCLAKYDPDYGKNPEQDKAKRKAHPHGEPDITAVADDAPTKEGLAAIGALGPGDTVEVEGYQGQDGFRIVSLKVLSLLPRSGCVTGDVVAKGDGFVTIIIPSPKDNGFAPVEIAETGKSDLAFAIRNEKPTEANGNRSFEEKMLRVARVGRGTAVDINYRTDNGLVMDNVKPNVQLQPGVRAFWKVRPTREGRFPLVIRDHFGKTYQTVIEARNSGGLPPYANVCERWDSPTRDQLQFVNVLLIDSMPKAWWNIWIQWMGVYLLAAVASWVATRYLFAVK
jgi:uncharacterized membrane protein (DUF106 family)